MSSFDEDGGDSPVTLGRIATRRMTGEELRAVRAQDAGLPSCSRLNVEQLESATLRWLSPDPQRLAQARVFAHRRGVGLLEALVEFGLLAEDDLIAKEAELTAGRWISADQLLGCTDMRARDVLTPEVCQELRVFPVALDDDGLQVAMRDPFDLGATQAVGRHTGGLRVVPIRAGNRALAAALRVLHPVDENDPKTWLER